MGQEYYIGILFYLATQTVSRVTAGSELPVAITLRILVQCTEITSLLYLSYLGKMLQIYSSGSEIGATCNKHVASSKAQ